MTKKLYFQTLIIPKAQKLVLQTESMKNLSKFGFLTLMQVFDFLKFDLV